MRDRQAVQRAERRAARERRVGRGGLARRRSASRVTIALTAGLTASIRARWCSITSTRAQLARADRRRQLARHRASRSSSLTVHILPPDRVGRV